MGMLRNNKTSPSLKSSVEGAVLLTLVALFVLGAPAWGADPPSFVMQAGRLVPVTVVVDQAKIYRQPSRSAPAGAAAYLQVFHLMETKVEAGTTFYKVGAADLFGVPLSIAGWLAEDDVLLGARAIQDEQGVFLKALVINEWRRVPQKGEVQRAALWNGPFPEKRTRIGEIGLFSFYYVFKIASRNGEKSYLLGEASYLSHEQAPGQDLVGWVDGKRLVSWSTRYAVELDKASAPARIPPGGQKGAQIFHTSEELVASLQGLPTYGGKKIEPIAVEDPEGQEWLHSTPRFPLFETVRNTAVPAAGELYHIGFIGDQIDLGELASGSPAGAPAEKMGEMQDKMRRIRRRLDSIDLLFVIDSTGSMRNYFSTVASAVTEIAETLRQEFPIGDGGPRLRFSVVFYRDYVDEEGRAGSTYLTKRLPFTSNTGEVARFLENEADDMPCVGCGGDEPEAVFHAIDYALAAGAAELAERRDSFRAVVLIGDKGNHEPDPRGFDVARVAKALAAHKCDFFSLQVAAPKVRETDGAARLFEHQSREISRLLGSPAGHVASRDPAAILAGIVSAAHTVGRDVLKMQEYLGQVMRGEIGLIEGGKRYGVRTTRRLTEMMEAEGVDPTLFLQSSVQIFERGWIAELDPVSRQPQVRLVLLVERATLESLEGIWAGLTSGRPTPETIEASWAKVLQDLLPGEVDPTRPLNRWISSHLGLPIRQKLLKRSLRELGHSSPAELQQLFGELEEELLKIRALIQEERIVLERIPAGKSGFTVQSRKLGRRPIWWAGQGRGELGWIPVAELP